MNKITITAGKQRNSIDVDRGSSTANVNITKDLSAHYSEVARDWATKMGGMVNNEDYSSKYYANQSKNHSDIAQENKEMAQEYSANAEEKYNLVVEKVDGLDAKAEQLKAEIEEVTEQEKAELEQKGKEVKQDIQDDIQSQVNYVNDNLATIDEKLNNVTNTVLSHNMFDVVQKDHVLTFEESKGLVAFGDYAYKTGSDGTRYGYPEFYNRCLKEYNEAKDYQMPYATKLVLNGNVVCRDTRTSEGKEGQIYLTNFSTENYASFDTYYGLPFDKPQNNNARIEYSITFRTGDDITTQQCLFGWLFGVYIGIKSSKILLYASSNGTSWNIASQKLGTTTLLANTEYTVSVVNINGYYIVSLDGYEISNTEIEISNTAFINTTNAQDMTIGMYDSGDIFLGDIVLAETKRNNVTGLYGFNDYGDGGLYKGFYYSYTPDFDNTYEYYPVLTTPVKYHNNKHVFYNPIENIDRNYGHPIDYLYNQTGMAWLYGIDTTNERVRMPRNDKYFMCGTDAGTMVQAGLPNIEGVFTAKTFQDASLPTGCFVQTWYDNGVTPSGTNKDKNTQIEMDASRSSSIYGNSDTVQTDAVKLMGYICVGNTETEVSSTEVTEVTTTENDTLPLGFSDYFTVKPNHPSWLKSSYQFYDASIYETMYNWLVANKATNSSIKSVNGTYTDYDFVLDEVNMKFRLPLKNGKEGRYDVKVDFGNTIRIYKESSVNNVPFKADAYGHLMVECVINTTNEYVQIDIVDEDENTRTLYYNLDSVNSKYNYVKVTEDIYAGETIVSISRLGGNNLSIGYKPLETQVIVGDKKADLYFKVGNAVANQELIDVGTLTEVVNNKIDINSGYVDGQWKGKVAELSTEVKAGTYTLDLSEYLPNDEYTYDVKIMGHCYKTGSTASNVYITTNIDTFVGKASMATANSRQGRFYNIYTVDTTRIITMTIDLDVAELSVTGCAYRRLGKNQ